MMKRITSIVLMFCVLSSLFVFVSSADNYFIDVTESDWFYSDVTYVFEKGIMNGTAQNRFDPAETTTRAMVATILWRIENSPEAKTPSGYADVADGKWYSNAIAWMKEVGLTNGKGNNTFGTEDPITREELATFFYRYAAWKNGDMADSGKIAGYADFVKISDWAVKAMSWANGKGLITGESKTDLNPQGRATRAQIAAILHRYLDPSIAPKPDNTHVHAYSAAETVSPTCTKQGYTIYTCSCGMQYKDDYVAALGHQMGEYVSDGSRYTEDEIGFYGKQVRTCQRCGFKETKSGLIRKWEDFDIAKIENLVLQYAIEKYNCVYEPSFSTEYGHGSYDFPVNYSAYNEEDLAEFFCGTVDDTFERCYIADQGTVLFEKYDIHSLEDYLDHISDGNTRCKVIVEYVGHGEFECYFIYG